MKNGKHLDGPALEALAAGAPMPEAKFHVVECDECRAKLAAMRWENALFAGELREAGEHRPASHLPAPAPLPPAPLRAQTTWLGSTFSGGFAVPSAVAAVLVLGSAVALGAFLFGNRGGEETAGVQDEPIAAPEKPQVAGDGEKSSKDAKDEKDAARTVTWKGKTAQEWLEVWLDAMKEAKAKKEAGAEEEARKERLRAASTALAKLGAASIPSLVEAIGRNNESKEPLCLILAAIQPRDEEVPAFLALLKHENYAVRGSAVMTLRSKVNDPRVEAALRAAAKDSDRAVAEAAEAVLAPVQARQEEMRQLAADCLAMANRAEEARKFAEAAQAYSKCLQVDPNMAQAKEGLARCQKAMLDANRAATAADEIETTLVRRERADAEKTGVKPVEPPVSPAIAPDAAVAASLSALPQTFATQASKDAAIAQAEAVYEETEATIRLAQKEYEKLKQVAEKGSVSELEVERAKTQMHVGMARAKAAKAQLDDLRNRPVAKDGAQAAKDDQPKAQDEIARLREQVEKLTQIVQEQKQAVEAARDEQARMRQGPPQGMVLAIKAEEGLVMVSMGKEQGVQAGQVFGVLREGVPIARLKIEKVYPDMSSAKVLPDSLAPGQTVQVRDEVKLPPPRPRREMEGEEGMGMPPMLDRGQGEGEGKGGQQPRPKRPKRPDNAGGEHFGPPPGGEGQDGGQGDRPPPPQGNHPKRTGNAGEEGIGPRPQGMDGQGQGDRPMLPPPPRDGGQGGQGGRPKFPPPPPRDGEQGGQGEGNRPLPPHGMMPPDGQPPKCDKDKNGAEEGLEF